MGRMVRSTMVPHPFAELAEDVKLISQRRVGRAAGRRARILPLTRVPAAPPTTHRPDWNPPGPRPRRCAVRVDQWWATRRRGFDGRTAFNTRSANDVPPPLCPPYAGFFPPHCKDARTESAGFDQLA